MALALFLKAPTITTHSPALLDFVLTFGSAELTSNICAPILSRLIVSVDALSFVITVSVDAVIVSVTMVVTLSCGITVCAEEDAAGMDLGQKNQQSMISIVPNAIREGQSKPCDDETSEVVA